MPPQLLLGVGSAIGECVLRKLPDAFVGVELRGVAREAIEVQSREDATQRSDRVPFVNASIVPDEDDRSTKVPEQVSDKGADLGMLDVLGVEAVVEAEPPPPGAHEEAGDDRDSIAALPMEEQRRLAAWRPGLVHAWNQEEARLVDEDEVGTQPRDFFLMRGHSSVFQRAIASSLRSRADARASGA